MNASFGGYRGWDVTFLPEFGSCEIRAPDVRSVFESRDGEPESVLKLGEMIFFDANGREVARVVHEEFKPPPIQAIIAAAKKAGDYGILQFQGGFQDGKVSLFGLLEAVEYAEKTCKVALK